jgi:regulator of protease activity HflC (stomatin/prohibitin superfamily)
VLDKLIDFLLSVVDLFYFTRVVDSWEKGVVLRFGRYKRTVGPGIHWVAPFMIERLISADVYARPFRLPPQSLTTADGVAVVVSAVVTCKVANVRKVLLDCGNHEEALADSLTGTIAQQVTGAAWSDLTTDEFWRTVTTATHERARKWGLKVIEVQPADVARCKSLRLFQPSPPPPAV